MNVFEFGKQHLTLTADALHGALPKWPVLTIVHFIITSIALRMEPGGYRFAINYPIASCSINIFIASSGGIIANLILGRPLFQQVADEKAVLCYILIWYLINFSPNDIVFSFFNFQFVKYLLNILEEIRRSKNIMTGVVLAASIYPKSLLLLAITGMFKGSGKKWSITFYRLLMGSSLASNHELLSITFTTKASFLLGMLYAMSHTYDALGMSNNECVMLGAVILATLQFYNIWNRSVNDPFKFIQEKLWFLLDYRNDLITNTEPLVKTNKQETSPENEGSSEDNATIPTTSSIIAKKEQ